MTNSHSAYLVNIAEDDLIEIRYLGKSTGEELSAKEVFDMMQLLSQVSQRLANEIAREA